jgi:NAD(P)H-dependent FMN reductase
VPISPFRVLAISGSLRSASSNGVILRAAQQVAPPDVTIALYEGLATLPHFNPDLDSALGDPLLPAVVRELRAAVENANAVVISSPEYAHGVPGSLKNALDWLVGGSEMVGKPVALWNTAPHATHAQASLAETLRTMSAHLVSDTEFSIALRGRSAEEVAADIDIARQLLQALDTLRRQVPSNA